MEQEKLISLPDYFRHGYVLVVDDASNMRKTIKGVLRGMGIAAVHDADDGDTALEVLRTTVEKCLFILLDWNMPRKHGIEVAKELKSSDKTKHIPILMITAEGNYAQVTYAGEFGVEGYVMKPFGSAILEEKMTAILVERLRPPNSLKLLKAGEDIMSSGQYEKALAFFAEALKHEDSAKIYVSMAGAYEKLGMLEEAKKAFNDAVERNPKFLKAHTAAYEFFSRIGDADQAMRFLKNARDISPINAERHAAMGKLCIAKGDEHGAAAAFNEAIKYDPTQSTVIAEELMKAGKAEMAEAYFRWSLENENSTVHVYNRLGIALRRQGKWEDATKEYKRAIELDPEDEILYFNMGKAYMEGRRKREATQCFENALKINPEFKEARDEIDAILTKKAKS